MNTYKTTLFIGILALASAPSIRCMGEDDADNNSAIVVNNPDSQHYLELLEYTKLPEFNPDEFDLKIGPDTAQLQKVPTITRSHMCLGASTAATAYSVASNLNLAKIAQSRGPNRLVTPAVGAAQVALNILQPAVPIIVTIAAGYLVWTDIEDGALLKYQAKRLKKENAQFKTLHAQAAGTLKNEIIAHHNIVARTEYDLQQIVAKATSLPDAKEKINTLIAKLSTAKKTLRQNHLDCPDIQKDPNFEGWFGWFKKLCHRHEQDHTIVHNVNNDSSTN